MNTSTVDNSPLKDEQWAIKSFRPLLKALHVQDMPSPPEFTLLYIADYRHLVIQGMGHCIIVIERYALPQDVGGMLITSYNKRNNFFLLHILINQELGKQDAATKRNNKIAAVHEFTHTTAALCAVGRTKSDELVKRLKEIFSAKSHPLLYADIQKVAEELTGTLLGKLQQPAAKPKKPYFEDAHYRLGFEDFPISYPVFFQDLLFSKELFEEYFTKEIIKNCCKLIYENDSTGLGEIINTICHNIANDKALSVEFVISKTIDNIMSHYIKYKKQRDVLFEVSR
ncbi:hypothetical protein LQZ19_17065 [Treponema primitia]|uniref:hypothetical protein n=1 Tax=Treponema primitia TaxID=88058 RepID=UPI0039801241